MENAYNNYKDIEAELRRLSLERQIAKEEIKSVKGDIKDSLQPAEWLQTGLKIAGKIGSVVLLKKIFKR